MRSKQEHTEAILRNRKTAIVVNTRSRRGRRHLGEALRQLRTAGFPPRDLYRITDPTRLRSILDDALAGEPDLLVVGGGDGTLSSALRHLHVDGAGRDVALGVLPMGTTNNFARSLGIPLSLSGAVAVLTSGKVADIDVGIAGDRPFANLVSFGVSVEVAGTVKPWLKRLIGRAAYPMTALTVLPGHTPFKAYLTVDGTRHELLTHQLNIANGRFHGGWQIARDAGIDNRRLVAYQLGSGKRLRLLAETMARAATGRWRSMAGASFVTGSEMLLETVPPLAADIDGEVRLTTPLTIRSIPNGVRVMVPADFMDT
ncbi:diacylglycerol kinase [Streptosporangiaceae bacterium NEAU-GS5]|nr:diacylglycerol kinase [Streptosporangiaceae bacterium NEAU-GS5]